MLLEARDDGAGRVERLGGRQQLLGAGLQVCDDRGRQDDEALDVVRQRSRRGQRRRRDQLVRDPRRHGPHRRPAGRDDEDLTTGRGGPGASGV